jgi:hypothetical protein
MVRQLQEALARAKLSQQVHRMAGGSPFSSAAALPTVGNLAPCPPEADAGPISHALFLSNSTMGSAGPSREGSPEKGLVAVEGLGQGLAGGGRSVLGADHVRLAAMKAAVGLAREAESLGLIVPIGSDCETASEGSPGRL